MPPTASAKKAPDAAHRVGLTHEENALFCWLHGNPAVAKTYGIEAMGKTTIGSMLLQTLKAQGMYVKWHKQLPNGAEAAAKTPNDRGAMWIKKVSRRPGAHMKQLKDRPEVKVPPDAAINSKGRGPRISFPLLLKLAVARRKKIYTNCGNKQTPPG